MADQFARGPIRGVLFDLDGTLLDTLEDIADSCNAALASLGLPVHDVQDYRRLVGEGIEVLALKAMPEEARSQAAADSLLAAIRREYSHRWDQKTKPYPGVPELLDALARRSVPTGILSNKPDDFTKLAAERLLPRWSFTSVAGAKPGVPKKPDPSAALGVARLLGIPPHEIAYVGDSGLDVRMAVAAGMRPAGALWGFRPWEVEEASPEILLRHPMELVPFLPG